MQGEADRKTRRADQRDETCRLDAKSLEHGDDGGHEHGVAHERGDQRLQRLVEVVHAIERGARPARQPLGQPPADDEDEDGRKDVDAAVDQIGLQIRCGHERGVRRNVLFHACLFRIGPKR